MVPKRIRTAISLTVIGATMFSGCASTSKDRLADRQKLAPHRKTRIQTAAVDAIHDSPQAPTDHLPRGGLGNQTNVLRTVAHVDEPVESQELLVPPVPSAIEPSADNPTTVENAAAGSNMASRPSPESMPIDLPTALRLAGANHLQIALARERIREAAARLDQANVLWVPSANVGMGYNRHDGRIQDTRGDVFDVSRQSFYLGGGPAIGSGAPLSGGASGPARMFVDLSLSDVFFQPLVSRQAVRANQFESAATFNDSLLQVALLYQELVRAQMQVEIATEAVHYAEELSRLTENFALAGEGLEADAQRARAELEQRRAERAVAQERVQVVSAEIVRMLRLDPSVALVAVDPLPLPLDLLPDSVPVEELVGQSLTRRPELAQHQSRVAETLEQIRQEQWRPWLPHLFVGYAGAGFGGGPNRFMGDFGGRGDFDALAIWEWKNFGMGNRALRQERESQHRQAHLQYEWLRDQIIAEVSQAYYRSTYRREQIEHARRQVAAAAEAVPLNFNGIRDRQLRPIEAQQAIVALAAARSLYLASVIDYNQAQLELLRAIGEPPAEGVVPSNVTVPATPTNGDAALWPSQRLVDSPQE